MPLIIIEESYLQRFSYTLATQAAIDEIAETKEKVELELQRSQMLLDTSDGIKVKIDPNY